jgi:hypothetical protein
VALSALAFASCKPDSVPTYEDVNRVYFGWATSTSSPAYLNNIFVSMGYDSPVKADSTIAVRVRSLGRMADVDRPVAAEVIRAESSAVPGEDIQIVGGSIPAGKRDGYIYVKVINSDKLLTDVLQARIRLVPNDWFHVDWNDNHLTSGNTSGIEYNVWFDAMVEMPNLWKDASSTISQYFGSWSRVKEMTIYQVLGFDREFFTYDPTAGKTAAQVLNERIPSALVYGMVAAVNRYLRAYKEANGNPLLDENGFEVKMGVAVY